MTTSHSDAKPQRPFWMRVDLRDETDSCWLWLGALDSLGYGRHSTKGVATPAHRIAYEQTHGCVPVGLEIDHLCETKACCNPWHLEAKTHRENVMRSNALIRRNAATGACKSGHAFTPENTYITPRGWRQCRQCQRERLRECRDARRKSVTVWRWDASDRRWVACGSRDTPAEATSWMREMSRGNKRAEYAVVEGRGRPWDSRAKGRVLACSIGGR